MAVATITESSSFAKEVLEDRSRVLVSFRAAGCLPSRQMVPAIEEVAKDLGGKVKFVAVDVAEDDWSTNAILREQNITRLPVVMLFEGGKVKDFIGGSTSKAAIAEMAAGKRKRLTAGRAKRAAPKKPVVAARAGDFKRTVLESDSPVLVHFHSAACRQSLALLPEVESIAAELDAKAKVVRLDFDKENAPLFERFGVHRLPTLALFRDGKVVDQIFGAMTGGAKVGDRLASCVNLTTVQNIAQMVEGGA
jgi:thioredoxin 1